MTNAGNEPTKARSLAEIQTAAFDRLVACERWLTTTVREAIRPEWKPQLDAWFQETLRLREALSTREVVRVAMVGTTGAGKSSLLNAVLGAEVLPVGVMEPCTAFVTRVQRSDDQQFHATISYSTADEWEAEIARLQSAFGSGEPENGGDAHDEVGRLRRAAEKRLQAVYGMSVSLTESVGKLFGELLPAEVARVLDLDGPERTSFATNKDMLAHVKKLVRGESCLWPLVKEVIIEGPFDALPASLEIVDLPGLNDPNEARIEVTRSYLQSCPNVWVVFPMVRGLTDDIHRILRNERVFQRMVMNGTYHGLCLVGTKADDVDANVADQLGLEEDVPQTELVREYCRRTKEKAREQLRALVNELDRGAQDQGTIEHMLDVVARLPVHTTSSDEFRRMRKIGRTNKAHQLESEEDTGIPGLHQLLAQIAADSNAGQRAQSTISQIERLVEEVLLFFRARTRPAGANMDRFQQHVAGKLTEFASAVANERDAASRRIDDRAKAFVDRVAGLLDATNQAARRVTNQWTGIHWATLRAVVHRDGSFRSSSGRNYDLSAEVADCLVQHLPVAWERFFTDDLGRVVDEFGIRITERGESFCKLVEQALEWCLRSKVGLEQSVGWFREKVRLLIDDSKNRVVTQARERRSELASSIYTVAHQQMLATFNECRREQGPGMKQRILDRLLPAALAAVKPLFETMRHDLVASLTGLQSAVVGILQQVSDAATEKGRTMADNSAIDAKQAVDPAVARVLASQPMAQ
jgi:hypothetical protein